MIRYKPFLLYLVKFLGAFCLLFYGTEAVIGLSAPGERYNDFVAEHLDFITPFRFLLLKCTQAVLSLTGHPAFFRDSYTLSLPSGKAIKMVYSCLGYGVLSFWIAFVAANSGSVKRKATWMVTGCLLLCAINVMRISLLLLALEKGWTIPFGWDHHTWFTVVAYGAILLLVAGYEGRGRQRGNKAARQGEEAVLVMRKEAMSNSQ